MFIIYRGLGMYSISLEKHATGNIRIYRIIERSMNVTICTPCRDKNRSTLRETEKDRAYDGRGSY